MGRDEGLRRQLVTEFAEERRGMAGKDFVRFRESFGGHTALLQIKVLVPVCPDCYGLDMGAPVRVPTVNSDGWETDLLLLGFPPKVIEKLQIDIDEGIEPERGPWCYVCGDWLPWWENEEGCYTKEVEFTDYFSFEEKEHPDVRKWMKKRIIEMYGRKCFSCNKILSDDEITIDHIVARSRGGTGNQFNLQVLCEKCNNSKGDKAAVDKKAILHFPMRPVPSDDYEGVTW